MNVARGEGLAASVVVAAFEQLARVASRSTWRSVRAAALRLLLHRCFASFYHLLRREVLDTRRDQPHLAERIGDRPEAIAPELIGDLGCYRCARVDRLLDGRIDILDVENDLCACAAQFLR